MKLKQLLLISSILFVTSCKPSSNKITVTFKNGDETLEIVTGEKGLIIYDGDIPSRMSDDSNFEYDFIGWNKDLSKIKNNCVINSTYQAIKLDEFDDGEYTYREIYNDSLTTLIGYEIRYYNNFEYDGTLSLPETYNNLPILRIGEACFMDTLISEIALPSTIRVIDSYAFNTIENLTSLNIPDSCRVIKNASIFYASKLTTINLNRVEFIGIDNFHLCPKLDQIMTNPSNNTFTSENGVLYTKDYSTLIKVAENVSSLHLNDKLRILKEESLSRLMNLEYVEIPKNVSEIPTKLFFESKVKRVSLKGNIKIIGERAFSHCKSMEEIELPNTIQIILDRAFYHCESLLTITLPNSLESIGEFSLAYCYSLQALTIPSSLKEIGYGALDEQSSLQRFIVDENNNYFSSFDDCLYSNDYSELLRVPETKENIVFNDSTTIIGSGALYKCQNISELEIPNTIVEIKDYAFYFMNNINNLNIPDTVLIIGEGAFQSMEELTSIHLPVNLLSIEKALFANCPLLQEVNIPRKITIIKDDAFNYCINLPILTLPKSITSFGKDTFAACDNLNLINFEGTSSEWSKIANRDICGLTSETTIVFNYVIE